MACGDIRDNLRSNLTESRQQNRDRVVNSKRKALQDVVNLGRIMTIEEVEILGSKLKNKSAITAEDLALLKLAFVQSESNIVSFLKVKGALHALVRELSSGKSIFELAAAECCCNLALGDPKTCLQVAKAAGPYLVAILSGYNFSLIATSVWALGNLAGSDEKTWQIIHTQGFLGKLLHLIREHDTNCSTKAETDVQQNSLSAMIHVLRVGAKLLTPDEIVSIAETIARLSQSSGTGLRVCEYLLSCTDIASGVLIEHKVHLKCLECLEKNEAVAMMTPALRTIANLVAEPSGTPALDVFAHWNVFQEIVQQIFSSPHTHLVNELGWLLGNLINHPAAAVQSAVEEMSFDFEIFQSQFAFFSC